MALFCCKDYAQSQGWAFLYGKEKPNPVGEERKGATR